MNTLVRTSLVAVLALSPSVVAQSLLKDINQLAPLSGRDADPDSFVSDGATWAYFSARSVPEGVELWRTDGTVVQLVADLEAGVNSSSPTDLHWTGSRLVFLATVGGATGMYGYDPATTATESLGPFDKIWSSAQMGGVLYFFGDDGDGNGVELRRTDGTALGTTLVKDIRPGLAGSCWAAAEMQVLGSELLFNADDGSASIELWKSDGTAAGTVMVKDIAAGGVGSSPADLVTVGGHVYFRAYTQAVGEELWKSDGTTAGTVLVQDIRSGALSSQIRVSGSHAGQLFFWADDDGAGWDFWVSAGTSVGTSQIASFGAVSTPDDGPAFASLGTKALFMVEQPLPYHNLELWQSDGTSAGTSKLLSVGHDTKRPVPYRMVTLGNQVLFVGPRMYYQVFIGGYAFGDWELWSCDGTLAGTQRVADIEPLARITSLAVAPSGTELLLAADDRVRGTEPWISDGTVAGTRLIDEVRFSPTGETASASPTGFVDAFGRAYFAADDAAHGVGLWSSDGTEAGTQLVWSDAVTESGTITELTPFGDQLLMAASARELIYAGTWTSLGVELFISDGTTSGTRMLKDLFPGGPASSPSDFVVLGNKALFWAEHSGRGREPWITDGTEAGTYLLKDIVAGSADSVPGYPVRLRDRVFFTVDNGVYGTELWKTDGTEAGTLLVRDIVAGSGSSHPRDLTVYDGRIFFTASTSPEGRELWVSDGSWAGTQMLLDLWPGLSSAEPQSLTVAGRQLFFWASDYRGRALWVSDGTAAGTQWVQTLSQPGGDNSTKMVAAGDRLFFAAATAGEGEELWVSDGTAPGTNLTLDIWPGRYSARPNHLVASGSRKVFFVADDGVTGSEIWQSDGTAAGTVQLADIRPGSQSSTLTSEMLLVNGKLLWVADDGIKGKEVWVHDPGASSKPIGRGSGLSEPRLMSSEAVIGGTWQLSVDSEIPSSFGYLALSPPAQPTSLFMPNFLAQDNQIYLDLVTALSSPLIFVSTDAGGDWSLTVPVPGGMSPSPVLCVQGVLINGGKWDLTNAVHFTIGY